MSGDRRGRDEDAVLLYGPSVYRLAYARLQNRQDAEDVYQEVFLRYVQRTGEFRDAEHEKAWLLRVTLNCCKDLFRSAWRRNRASLEEAEGLSFAGPSEADLHRELQKLSPADRTVLHLHYWEDLTGEEIARITRSTPAAVRQRLRRARARLKTILEQEGIDCVEAGL